jgi:hypothetical protein
MGKELNELLEACKSSEEVSDEKLLEIGDTCWLLGQPAPSAKDAVSLRTRSGFIVVVEQKDVVEVKKHEQQFLVKVRKGTDVLCKFSAVSQIGMDKLREKGSCGCHGGNKEVHSEVGPKPHHMNFAARQNEGDWGPYPTDTRNCNYICGISWYCDTVIGPFNLPYLFCMPVLYCLYIC